MQTIDGTGTVHAPAGATPDDVRNRLMDAILAEVDGSLRELKCASTGRLVKSGVSMGHLHVLWQLEHHGEMSMSRIAEILGVSMSNATGLIDRMEERGLVERVRVPDDRRLVLVRPATEGLRVIDEVEGLRREGMRAVLEHLDQARLARMAEAFADLREAVAAEFGRTGGHPHYGDSPLATHVASPLAAPEPAVPVG
jgi:MarR family transcriptional regulator, organic hydroperoxide resistance regulator